LARNRFLTAALPMLLPHSARATRFQIAVGNGPLLTVSVLQLMQRVRVKILNASSEKSDAVQFSTEARSFPTLELCF